MSVTINEAALDEVLHGLSGPVQRHVYEKSVEVLHAAALHINRSDGPGPHMADSGIVEDTVAAGGPGFLIAFESPHAEYYYYGTQAHIIRPKTARVLAFKWPKMGPGIFFARSVQHPGTPEHHIFREATIEVFGVEGAP